MLMDRCTNDRCAGSSTNVKPQVSLWTVPQAFQPRAPELTTFKVKPCDLCGGHLEVTVNVSEELQLLRDQLEHQKKVEDKLRLEYATQSYQLEALTVEKSYQDRTHAQEKTVLYGEMKKLKAELDQNHDTSVAHKRQMQQMKQSIADHEKTKLKLRAAELKAEDAKEVRFVFVFFWFSLAQHCPVHLPFVHIFSFLACVSVCLWCRSSPRCGCVPTSSRNACKRWKATACA